jgi:hypothetical protein
LRKTDSQRIGKIANLIGRETGDGGEGKNIIFAKSAKCGQGNLLGGRIHLDVCDV